MPSDRAASSRPRVRDRGIDRAGLARRALELADEAGLEAVTMRRLAEHVGVPTMTLYRWFATKDELLDAMADAAVASARIAPSGDSWRARLESLMEGVLEALRAHPSGVRIRARGPVLGPAALRVSETALGILADAGFSHRDAAFAYRSVFLFTFGHAAFNLGGDDAGARRRLRGALAALPPDEHPQLSTDIDDLVDAATGDAAFRFGLGLLLDGLEPLRGAAGDARRGRRAGPG